jgi:hypothetical protein
MNVQTNVTQRVSVFMGSVIVNLDMRDSIVFKHAAHTDIKANVSVLVLQKPLQMITPSFVLAVHL